MWRFLTFAAVGLWLAGAPAQAAPQRVVSMNLCTDQLALLLAAPGQLISVSKLSQDPHYSALAQKAQSLPPNSGHAEEIAFLRPDLILAGSYSTKMTVEMLTRLGHQVELFEPENSLDDIAKNLRRMGALLGQEAKAEAMISQMEAARIALRDTLPPDRPRSLLYYTSGYTSGAGSLADEILRAAGLYNIAADLGFGGGGFLPLEVLVLAAPEVIITSKSYRAPSQSQDMQSHRVLRRLGANLGPQTSPEWSCATPLTLAAIAKLADDARQ